MLFDTDLLIIDQIANFAVDNYAIRDYQGGVVGYVQTVGDLASRMFVGNREFVIHDGNAPSFLVKDVVNFGRDRFEITTLDGGVLANIVKEFSMATKRLTVTVFDGSRLIVRGKWIDFHYEIDGFGADGASGRVAEVNRSWPGIGSMLLGHDRYVLGFNPGIPLAMRQAVLGSVIAIDCIRSKERN